MSTPCSLPLSNELCRWYLVQHDGDEDDELNAGLRRRGSGAECDAVSWGQNAHVTVRCSV